MLIQSHRTVTNGENVLNWVLLPRYSKRQETLEPSLYVKGASLLTCLYCYSLRVRLPTKTQLNLRTKRNRFQWHQKASTFFAFILCYAPECQYLPERSLCVVPSFLQYGAPVFMTATQKMPRDHLALVVSINCVPGSHGTVTNGETVLCHF